MIRGGTPQPRLDEQMLLSLFLLQGGALACKWVALLGCTSPLGNLRATKSVEMLLLQHSPSNQPSKMMHLGNFGAAGVVLCDHNGSRCTLYFPWQLAGSPSRCTAQSLWRLYVSGAVHRIQSALHHRP